MQVFIIGSPLETAKVLDKKRLNKQVIECRQIINAILGFSKSWANHPCTIQYREHVEWLICYECCLREYIEYMNGNTRYLTTIEKLNEVCEKCTPNFHTQEYFDNMKRRLYTKDNEHYKQFAHLGESYDNWYWVDDKWKIYKQK